MNLIKKLFHTHDFEERSYIVSETTCECGGWKMFHDGESPAGDCGNFRPMTGLKHVCKSCGHEEINSGYMIDKQCRILGVK